MRRVVVAMAVAGLGVMGTGCATGLNTAVKDLGDDFAFPRGTVVTTVGGSVNYTFDYGKTTAYGQQASGVEDIEKNKGKTVETVLFGLTPNTTYHYRLCARYPRQETRGCSKDDTFKTRPTPNFDAPSRVEGCAAPPCNIDSLEGWTITEGGQEGGYRFSFYATKTSSNAAPTGYARIAIGGARVEGPVSCFRPGYLYSVIGVKDVTGLPSDGFWFVVKDRAFADGRDVFAANILPVTGGDPDPCEEAPGPQNPQDVSRGDIKLTVTTAGP